VTKQIDLELLLQNMLALPEQGKLPVPEDLRYLVETVVVPLLNGQTVPLSSLDYDRFDDADLNSLERYIDKTAGRNSGLWTLEANLIRLAPFCLSQPVFC